MSNDLYVQVEDRYGAVASVYTYFDGNSKIVYHDSNGKKFYEEEFLRFPIEKVEMHAIDWALGKRDLSTPT
jgi:hypothetical protein